MTQPAEPLDPVKLAAAIVIGTLFLAVPFSIFGMLATYGDPNMLELGLRVGISSASSALVLTGIVMPFAMQRLRDPALRLVRWLSAGLTAGIAGAGLQSVLLVIGYYGWMPDMGPQIAVALGVSSAAGIVAAFAAWVVLKLWVRR
jgi:hypothetical protein